MRFFSALLLLLIISCSKPQPNWTGTWRWDFKSQLNEQHQVEIKLKEDPYGRITGTYCSQYNAGELVDCPEDQSRTNFDLQKVSPRSYRGSFSPNDSTSTMPGVIELNYSNKFDGIIVNIITEPDGAFLFPDEVIFLRKD